MQQEVFLIPLAFLCRIISALAPIDKEKAFIIFNKKMKDIIGIFCGELTFPKELMHHWDESNLFKGGIGGSEVWAIEIAKQFIKNGYRCIIFGDPEKCYVAESGIEYVTTDRTLSVIEATKFKYFIASRKTFILEHNINAEYIYLMLHDPFVCFTSEYEDLHMDKISKIAIQSDFQKRMIKNIYHGLTNEDFFRTFQGVDQTYYKDVDSFHKKNKMLWSSHKIRGSRFLIEKIFPLIRREIPDFEIDVCGYANDMTDEYFSKEGINVKGNVSKEELSRLQKESKIWIYPNFGLFENGRINDETFCITAVENALAKNALILADKTCFSSTLEGYQGFVGTELFDDDKDILDESKMDDFAKIIAKQAIRLLKDENYRNELAGNANAICSRYTWENAAKTFLDEFEKKEIPRETKRIIILSAICHRAFNLEKMFESIKKYLCNDAKTHVTWVLCQDKYNSKGDVSYIIDKCKEYQKENPYFGWFFCPTGKEQETNYGGEIFNDALNYVLQFYDKKKTWVYILDDDNTINPLMGEIVGKAMDTADKSKKRCICFNIIYENGVLAPMGDSYFDVRSKEKFIAYYYVTDPSQLLIRADLLLEKNGYPNGFNYDEEMWRYLLQDGRAEILLPSSFLGHQHLNNYQTTHNAIDSLEDKLKWEEKLKNDEAKSCYIGIGTNKDGNHIFHIDTDKLKKYFNELVY